MRTIPSVLAECGRCFVPLASGVKEPKNKVKGVFDAENLYTALEIEAMLNIQEKDKSNVGFVVQYPYVVVDIDDPLTLGPTLESLGDDEVILPRTFTWRTSKVTERATGKVLDKTARIYKLSMPYKGVSKIPLLVNGQDVGEIKFSNGFQVCPPSEKIINKVDRVDGVEVPRYVEHGQTQPYEVVTDAPIAYLDLHALLTFLRRMKIIPQEKTELQVALTHSATPGTYSQERFERVVSQSPVGRRDNMLFLELCNMKDCHCSREDMERFATEFAAATNFPLSQALSKVDQALDRPLRQPPMFVWNAYHPEEQSWDGLYTVARDKNGEVKKTVIDIQYAAEKMAKLCVRVNGSLFKRGENELLPFDEREIVSGVYKRVVADGKANLWSKNLQGELTNRFNLLLDNEPEYVPPIGTIPMANGLLNLDTMELEPYGNKNIINTFKVEYDPEATCPTIERWLEESFYPEYREMYLSLMAALFSGRELPYIVGFYGSGRNGKGIAKDIMEAMLGKRVTTQDVEILDKSDSFAKDSFINVKCIWQEEMRGNREITDLLKQVTGGMTVTVNYKHRQDKFTFRLNAAVWFDSNSPPAFNPSVAFYERLRVFRLPYNFVNNPIPGTSQKQKDPKVKRDAPLEVSGFFNMLVPYIKDYIETETIKGDIRVDMQQYNAITSIVQSFIEQVCVVNAEHVVERKQFAKYLERYCALKSVSMPAHWRRIIENMHDRVVYVDAYGVHGLEISQAFKDGQMCFEE